MYRRFLNNSDYLGIITQEALQQLTRGNDERFIQAEQSAEMSIVEYLSENYDVEKEFAKGKYIADYDRHITYPVGVHIYFDGQIHEVIRSKVVTASLQLLHIGRSQPISISMLRKFLPIRSSTPTIRATK